MMLLYKKERKQYNDAIVDNVSPSTIYGAEHLLRLFGMIITFLILFSSVGYFELVLKESFVRFA